MCGIAGYSLSPRAERRPDARGAGAAGRDRRARRRRGRVRASRRRRHRRRCTSSAPAPASSSRSAGSRTTRPRRSSTCATTRRATRRSRPTTTRSATAPSSGSTTGSSSTTRRSSPRTASSAPQPEMTVDSEAIFALAEQPTGRPKALEELCGAMATAWLDERVPAMLFLARGRRPPALDRHRRQRALLRLDPEALEVVERHAAADAAQARGRRGHAARVAAAASRGSERFQPDRSYVEEPPPGRARAHEGALVPRGASPRSPSRPSCSARPVPSGRDVAPSSSRRSRTRYWNVGPAPGCRRSAGRPATR